SLSRTPFASARVTTRAVFVRGSTRALSSKRTVTVLRAAAVIFGCMTALLVPKPTVDFPIGARTASTKARAGAFDLVTTFARPGEPSDPVSARENPTPRRSAVHDAFEPSRP